MESLPIGPSPLGLSSPFHEADQHWDAGDLNCGMLILELRRRVRDMAPRQTLSLVARDVSASPEIHAWCRLTRNQLIAFQPPFFLLQRRDDAS